MERKQIKNRANWQESCEENGFSFHTIDEAKYWNEGVYYEFSEKEIDYIEDSTNELYQMCLEVVKYVIENKLYNEFKIPESIIPNIEYSWKNQRDFSMYGRFDFSYNGIGKMKMLEFNADTPTSFLEASVIQFVWLKDTFGFPNKNQFNSIEENLIEYFKKMKKIIKEDTLYFTCEESIEDESNVDYMQRIATECGINTDFISLKDIGYNSDTKKFVDLTYMNIKYIFKLFAWEFLGESDFYKDYFDFQITFIEPAWKSILSNKALMVYLWKLYPNHPLLLETYFENNFKENYVKKPIYSREGANVEIYENNKLVDSGIDEGYGEEGFLYQELAKLPEFIENNIKIYPVIGSWIVNNQSCGIGIREDKSLITKNTSMFCPHLFT